MSSGIMIASGQLSDVVKQETIPEILRKSEIPDNALESNEINELKKIAREFPDLTYIEQTSRVALFEQNRMTLHEQSEMKKISNSADSSDLANESKKGLTDEEKVQIKKETGWSDEIINAISSMKEYEIYKKAGLVEAEINGKKCLIRPDSIDIEQQDEDGLSNRERVERGLSPIDKNVNKIELHHIGQHPDSPLAELTMEEHRGKENDSILHDKTKESEIDRNAFNEEKKDHWKTRATDLLEG